MSSISVSVIPAPSAPPTLCLNMIVKNESKIITRLLDSVANIIDAYCICDTGSTDNTIELIEKYFSEKNIPGKVIQEPFRDFGYNRSFSLKACDDIIIPATGLAPDYVLLLDADMIFWKNPEISPDAFKRMLLEGTAFYINQGKDTYYYKNTRIVKNRSGFSYWGVTHEYVDCPPNTVTKMLEKNVVFINDIGDGGAKTDKFLRDIRLLKKGLEELPNNDRYTFYLANSYKDAGLLKEAIETYKKRIEIGGWHEEVWYSYYNIGKCWHALDDKERAVCAWMDAYQFFPNRIENLYEIMQHYRYCGKNRLAYMFYMTADRMRKDHPERSYLFMQKDVYDYKIDYELTIIGYYCNLDNHDIILVSMKVISDPNVEEGIMRNVMSNYKFKSERAIHSDTGKWRNLDISNIGRSLVTDPDFVSSTPTFCYYKDNKWLCLVRYVNYKINDNGGYENHEKIETRNVVAIVEHDKVIDEKLLDYDTTEDGRYVGLEDVRLYHSKSLPEDSDDEEETAIYYNANRGLKEGRMVVEHGKIVVGQDSIRTTDSTFLKINGQRHTEKNWVMAGDHNKMVYDWRPLTIGSVDGDGEFVKTHIIKTPPFFKLLRGSCNAVKMPNNELWFLCHAVSYEDRRYYYHTMVVLDGTNYTVKKYTPFFTFEGEKVEYSLGVTYTEQENELFIGYSVYDRTTKYMTLNKKWFDDRFITLGL